MIDGLIQGGMGLSDRLSVYEYAYYLQFLPYGINPSGKECLVIGLGAGLVPSWYEARGVRTDIVDIDPDVVEIAKRYFGLAVSGDIIIADARYHFNTSSKRYDYVILDVFNGDTTPSHLVSLEAFRLMPRDTDPMRALQPAVAVLGMHDPDAADNSDVANLRKAARLTSQLATAICTHHTVCPYDAVTRDAARRVSRVSEALCTGCGTCVANCPSNAIQQCGFTDAQVISEVDSLLAPEPVRELVEA